MFFLSGFMFEGINSHADSETKGRLGKDERTEKMGLRLQKIDLK